MIVIALNGLYKSHSRTPKSRMTVLNEAAVLSFIWRYADAQSLHAVSAVPQRANF